MSRSIQKFILIAIVALTACGDPKRGTDPAPSTPPGKDGQKSTPLDGGKTGGSGNNGGSGQGGISQTDLNAILGTYSGTITKRGSFGMKTQNFILTLSTKDYGGSKYLYMSMNSPTGAIGNLSVEAYMGMLVVNGVYGNYYSFVSQYLNVGDLYDLPISYEYNYFGPTQFTMYIKDCGFANGGACLNNAQNVLIDYVVKQ